MLEIDFIIFLIAKLTTVLSRKYKDNKELEKDYKFIRDESRSMQAFLKNMKAKQDAGVLDDEQIEWYKQVKELSYDTERLINKYLSRSAYQRDPILRMVTSVMKYPADQNGFLSKMRDIKSRAEQIKERHERYKSINDKSNKISKHNSRNRNTNAYRGNGGRNTQFQQQASHGQQFQSGSQLPSGQHGYLNYQQYTQSGQAPNQSQSRPKRYPPGQVPTCQVCFKVGHMAIDCWYRFKQDYKPGMQQNRSSRPPQALNAQAPNSTPTGWICWINMHK